MPNRSLVRGDYTLLLAIESSSRLDCWYRVLENRQTGEHSCDCPSWVYSRNCPHVRFLHTPLTQPLPPDRRHDTLLHMTQEQWPGLLGEWQFELRNIAVERKPFFLVHLRLYLGNGGIATGTVAFSLRQSLDERRLIRGVAGWGGYAIAANVAQIGGSPLAGQPPEHYRVPRPATHTQASHPQPHNTTIVPLLGLSNILRVGDSEDGGDGLTPPIRAEHTLRLFLGEQMYQHLTIQGFLDVSSALYPQRVYRLRRDPRKYNDRRVRVFEGGEYCRDFCIVRGQDVPEADHFLTVFLSLLSDERATLSVVKSANSFPPYSDGGEMEVLPAIWKAHLSHSPTM